MSIFDECYSTLPDLSRKPADFNEFWDSQIESLKKVPFNESVKKKVSTKFLKEHNLVIDFQSSDKYALESHLLAPKKLGKKPPVVVIFGNYLTPPALFKSLFSAGIAQYFVRLRGHEIPLVQTESNDPDEEKKASYGYFAENLTEKNSYYLKHLLLDAYRSVEILRLRGEIDSSRISFFGEGVGALMAIFVATRMKRGNSIILQYPDFFKVDSALTAVNLTQNEIRSYVRSHRNAKNKIMDTLQYFDGTFFARDVTIPSKTIVNILSRNVSPHGAFAMFHELKGEKDIHIYTDDSPNMLKKEKLANVKIMIDFFQETLLGV